MFGEIDSIFDLRGDNELTYKATVEKINHLLECNKHLIFVQRLMSYNFDEVDTMMLILFSHLFVNNIDDHIHYWDLDFLFDDKCQWNHVKSQLYNGEHVLLVHRRIEYNS